MYKSIQPGNIWLDTEGKPIQCHGSSIVYCEKDSLYYWYGENKEKTKGGLTNRIWHWGMRYYTSRDLYNWEDKGLFIPPTPEDLDSPLHPTYSVDRPHILYCEKTGKFVCWLKIMCDEISQFMTVMQSDNFMGPYEIVRKVYKPLKMNTGDFTLVKDENTDKAYFIFDRPHFELITATLSNDYTEVSGEYSEHYTNSRPPFSRESPAYFKQNGKHYLITSGTTGYYPNPTWVCTFDDFHGGYKDLGEFCLDDTTGTSFFAQYCWVLKPHGSDHYIAMADRWKPTTFDKWLSKRYYKMVDRAMSGGHYKRISEPDTSPKEAGPLPLKEQIHTERTCIGRYVWLPIEWEGEKPFIRWKDEWRLEDY